MKKIHTVFFFLFIFCSTSFSQGPWTQKASFGGLARHRALAFSIGTRGYLGCGWNGVTMYSDFWEYDPASNTWTQKADYPPGPRLSAFAFSIGNKGYAGAGLDEFLYGQSDFYEYDPATNTWTNKASFSMPLFGCTAVSYGGKGYVCFGDEWDPTYLRHGEMYEYDPTSDAWNYTTTFPGFARRDAIGFTLGTKLYFGTGNDENYYETKDFWEYDPASGIWTQKSDFAGTVRSQAVAFAVNGKGYAGTGGTEDVQDFWEYDPATNLWDSIDDFPGAGRENSMSFVIGNHGYLLCGTSGINYKDVWEFNPFMITGTAELSSNASAAIYPNPMITSATVSLKNIKKTDLNWILFDMNGKKMQEENSTIATFTIYRNDLHTGTYLLSIRSENKTLITKKIIIQ